MAYSIGGPWSLQFLLILTETKRYPCIRTQPTPAKKKKDGLSWATRPSGSALWTGMTGFDCFTQHNILIDILECQLPGLLPLEHSN